MDAPIDDVSLGSTGLTVSELPFGTWRFGREAPDGTMEIDRETGLDLLDAYDDAGGYFIDTADVYGSGKSEEWIGDWLAERDPADYVIASKIYWPTREDPNGRGLNRKHIRQSIDEMLDRLGIESIDLLYCHRIDDDTPIREFMRTLNGLVEDGKVHYLGASSFEPDAWKIAKANEIAEREGWEPFAVTQPRYNLVDREIEGEYREMCQHYDMGIVPWSPLAQGFLTGKYTRGDRQPDDTKAGLSERFRDRYLTEENFDVLDELRAVADEVDATLAQTALAWLLHRDGVTAPIVGARTVEQLEENLAAASVDLTDDQVDRLSAAKGGPFSHLN
jgi:aryl-alcohol dehydrogenase-like predicted oxidoreductase